MHNDKKKIDDEPKKKTRTCEIAEHYNTIQPVEYGRRHQSRIINIRNMNNFIKSVLIHVYTTQYGTALDLGCGKGGDMLKFSHQNIKLYTGIDIAHKSIEEAQRRHQSRKLKFKADLRVQDYTKPFQFDTKYDIISAQFTYHYSFQTEETFNTALDNILKHSKYGTYIIMTIPDKNTIIRRYKKYGNDSGNKFYRIKFKVNKKEEKKDIENNKEIDNKKEEIDNNKEIDNKNEEIDNNKEIDNKNEEIDNNKESDNNKDIENNKEIDNNIDNKNKEEINFNEIFGVEYTFKLLEAVDECPEYLVDTEYLINTFSSKNLINIENHGFLEFYSLNSKKFRELRKRMVPNILNTEELRVMELYRVLVFKRI